ncbi:MAG: PEP-CTERM sorting domain-containing protein [Phycisphaerales bacterium]
MPNGLLSGDGLDSTDDEGPSFASLFMHGGGPFTFDSTGSVDHNGATPTLTPDGDLSIVVARTHGAENGIADLVAPIDSLVGVFLGDTRPDFSSAPGRLDFSPSGLGTDFLTLSPALKQPFFIGDGFTPAGVRQRFIAPAGATRLYLGTMDRAGWSNNTGAFHVLMTPTPGPVLLGAVAGVAWIARRRRGNAPNSARLGAVATGVLKAATE